MVENELSDVFYASFEFCLSSRRRPGPTAEMGTGLRRCDGTRAAMNDAGSIKLDNCF